MTRSAKLRTNTRAPTGLRPTARLSDSTAPWLPNGPTSATTAPTRQGPAHTRRGSMTTITTDPTPVSAANHPSTAFTTSVGRTPRFRDPGGGAGSVLRATVDAHVVA